MEATTYQLNIYQPPAFGSEYWTEYRSAFTQAYLDFVKKKIRVANTKGFDVDPKDLHPSLKPHQKDSVVWALRQGRAMLAHRFGLGKSRDQIDIAKLVVSREGGPFLLVTPLGVRHQFVNEDGPVMDVKWAYVRNDQEALAADTPYLITNYERVRDGNLSPAFLATVKGVSLDEGSVLRNMGSETSDVFKKVFKNTKYKFVCTATPDPNNRKELIYYAEWLGVADHGLALTEFFKRNPNKAGDLVLMESQAERFWLWVSTWAMFLSKPSDLGYSDEGYTLPPLNVTWHRLPVDYRRAWEQHDDRGQRRLIPNAANGISEAAQERRATLDARIAKIKELLAAYPDRNWIIWHDLEDERKALEKAIPDIVTVYGSQDLEEREQRILDFAHGKIKIFGTKPEIAGSGCNFQHHCYSAIYMGVGYKFEDFIQSVHRLYRFMQTQPVDIHIIHAESEDDVVSVLKRKWAEHDEQASIMQGIIKKYKLSTAAIQQGLARELGVDRRVVKGQLFTAYNNDTVLEVLDMPDNSVDEIETSIPFGDHYEYTNKLVDFGHNSGDGKFWEQMDFLIPHMLRVTKPGRIAFVHVKDRQLYGHQTQSGIMETAPFSDQCVMAFIKHGWTYQGRRTIPTDVVRENNQTYRLGYTEMTMDATKMSSGLPEYVLMFRKPPSSRKNARADEPVTKQKPQRIKTCPLCNYEAIPMDVIVDTDFDEETEQQIVIDGKASCPGCGERVVFDERFTPGYGLGRWQLDAHSVWRSDFNRPLSPAEMVKMYPIPEQLAALLEQEQLTGHYDYERHVAICEELARRNKLPKTFMLLPPKYTTSEADWVWDDIVFMRTLNSAQSQKRKEKHICPLPFDIVERGIRLYSNEGDLVWDPFAGLMTVGNRAIKLRRRAILTELNAEYFVDGTRYCKAAEEEISMPTLFDMLNINQIQEMPVAAD